MIAGPIQKHLRFVFQTAECSRMNDPRAIALKFGAIRMAGLRILSAARIARFLCKRSESSSLGRFHFLAGPVAASASSRKLSEVRGAWSRRSLLGCLHFHTIIR